MGDKQFIQYDDGSIVGINRRPDGVLEIDVDGVLRGTVVGWAEPEVVT